MHSSVKTAVNRFNKCVVAWQDSPRLGKLVRRRMTVVTYAGRRSGREFSIPVAYFRQPTGVRIDVMMPDAKNWWRNFTGDGGPLSLRLDDTIRTGHAVAHRTPNGRVQVNVDLTETA